MGASSTRRRTFMASTGVLGPLFVVLASTNCYAPTEVMLSLSTDLDCSEDPRTRIYKGEPGRYETAPETEVTTCTPGAPDAQIGTLVVIPSAGTDGSAAVKIVLARNGKAPADCETDATNCIFATRSFSFASHASRRLPIRLLRDCLGTKCADGETCIAGGKCVSNRVECHADDCALPDEPPPPLPLPDGGRPDDGGPSPVEDGDVPPDASTDGTVLDGGDDDVFVPVPACVPSTGNDIVTTNSKMPVLTATGTTYHYWVDDRMPVEAHVMRVAKKGPGGDSIYDFVPNIDFPFALGVGGNTALVGYGDNVGTAMLWTGGNVMSAPSGTKRIVALASSGQDRIAVAGATGGVQERTPVTAYKSLATATASSVVAADDYYFIATNTGITRADPIPATPVTTPINGAPANAILAVSGETVYAAAKEAGSTWGIWRIPSNATNASLLVGGRGVMTSLASDGMHVYWTENNEIWRTTTAGGTAEKIFALAGMAVDHVTADGECLYFWTRRNGERAALRLGPRKPFTTVGPGPGP